MGGDGAGLMRIGKVVCRWAQMQGELAAQRMVYRSAAPQLC
jgi:hypothetical protein